MLRISVCLFLTVALVGCGSSDTSKPLPKTAPVSGVVTMNKKPLASATVTFHPDAGTKGTDCTGRTDEAGKYTLTQQHGAAGAPPGKYKVTVSLIMRGDGTPLPEDGAGEGGVAVETLSGKYSDLGKTTLKADVPESGGEINFDLKGKKKK
ncbi:carboxypeptidase-like regulatory domain-containing protein [uncultured Gimesia sp.]|uniref:carboxypeptidase-like regulatory domain-containing protein n=1 Tax=uncultured Gimesia sp. TaxID=1678688 RepID=UPI0026052334|nr:carboxypeptidase-like regulatory domain-containing protein [uncultured Gimesia sp.]